MERLIFEQLFHIIANLKCNFDSSIFFWQFVSVHQASERKLSALQQTPTPREELLDSIRRGRKLKHIQQPKLKSRRK